MIEGAFPAWATDQSVPLVWFIIALLTNPSRWSGWVASKFGGRSRQRRADTAEQVEE